MAYTPFELLEGGTVVKEIVLFEFSSVEIAKRWYTNPAYQEMDCSRKVSLRQQSTRLILKRAAMRCNYLAKIGENYTQIHRLKLGNPLFGEWFGLSTKQNNENNGKLRVRFWNVACIRKKVWYRYWSERSSVGRLSRFVLSLSFLVSADFSKIKTSDGGTENPFT